VPDSSYGYKLTDKIDVYIPLSLSYKHVKNDKLKYLQKKLDKVSFRLFPESIVKAMFSKNKDKTYAFLFDIDFRMADIMVRWNIIQHFYPYYEEDQLDNKWHDILYKTFINAAKCYNQYDYINVN
jgi:hypothetical protein